MKKKNKKTKKKHSGRAPYGYRKETTRQSERRGAINRVTGRDMVPLGVKPPTREEHLKRSVIEI